MSWLDQLQQASWRGVPFQVDTVETQAGDQIVLREYPFADLPAVFRMGAAAETIKFSAYVIGPDYREQRDQLRQVLSGEGVLVHPTSGAVRAFVASTYNMSEAPLREGGVVRFDLTFVRAEPRTYPSPRPNTQAAATQAADRAKASAVGQFASEFSLAGAPAWVQERVIDRLRGATDGVWSAMKGVTAGLGDFTNQATGAYQTLRDGVLQMANEPASLGGAVREMFSLPADLSAGAGAAWQTAFQRVFGLGSTLRKTDFESVRQPAPGQMAMYGAGVPEALGIDTGARAQLDRLNGSVDRLVDSMALASWVQAVAADDLAGHEQVQQQRAWLYQQCTGLLKTSSIYAASISVPATSWHDAMLAMLAAALGDMQARSADRSRLSAYTPQVCMSVWQLSYLLYGTADWADEILENNRHIEHPLLVPAGRPVRVVQHG